MLSKKHRWIKKIFYKSWSGLKEHLPLWERLTCTNIQRKVQEKTLVFEKDKYTFGMSFLFEREGIFYGKYILEPKYLCPLSEKNIW